MTARLDGIALSGPPGGVVGDFPVDVARSTVIPLSITVGREATVYRAIARPRGNRNELRVRLPADTPPGTYTGQATIEGKTLPVSIDVESVLRVRVQPEQTSIRAAPKATVTFALTLTNEGNIAFNVPSSDTFDFDDPVTQDRAMGRTLRATVTPNVKRVDVLFEQLRDGHGGEAQVSLKTGAGRLDPGESRDLTCVLLIPATVQAGRSYNGTWRLADAVHLIAADIATSTPALKARKKG